MTYNDGMNTRYLRFHNGQKVQLQGFLHSDIMGIQDSIVNGVEINITLIPNQDSIHLQTLAGNKYGRLITDDVVLYVCKCHMSKEVVVAHHKVMENTPASYPFMRTEVKTYNVHTGETEVFIKNPYLSQIPTRFIVGMVQANAYGGDRKLNPLKFQHYDISRAAFYIDN